ncbi:SDR family NAD(P)-dependent oxidoreductase [Paraburkholderia sediminicola]|uniref:SDR family oxidoreductase n=1 Tax=Paraburkholderia TaxID=1822464 RepID=UPI0038BC6BC8
MLTGKVAVVTGGGRGIGRAIAVAYAAAGASVVVAARSAHEIQAVAQSIRQTGGDAIACEVDVTNRASVETMFNQAAAHFGGVDIVIANAGAALQRGNIETCDPELWKQTVEVNLFGAFHTARAAIAHLRKRGGGKIVMTGSGSRFRPYAGGSAYTSSKLALWMLTQTLAMELEGANISVNELIPGPVKTAMTGFGATPFPPGEWVKEPEDVVPLAMFLATQPLVGPTAQSFSLMRRPG